MIIQPDFLTHWKVQALCGAIGRAEALTALLALWGHCQTSKAYVHRLTPQKLAGVCQYQGDPCHLLATFQSLDLLDFVGPGEFEVHGWAEKNGAFIKNWENGGKGGRPRKTAPENPNAVSDNPAQNPRVNPKRVSDNPLVNPNPETGNPALSEGRKEGIEGIEGNEGTEPAGPAASMITWNLASGWSGFTPLLRANLTQAFPGIDLDLACMETDRWLRDNPAKAKKKNWLSFLTNWLRRSSPSGFGSTTQGANQNPSQKNEEGAGPPAQLVRPAPDGPWRGAFEATYGRQTLAEWPDLPPAIQREIKDLLRGGDPLLLASWRALENAIEWPNKKEGAAA